MSEIADFLRARYLERRQAAMNAALTEGLMGSLVDFLKHEAASVDVGPSEQHYALQAPGYVLADLDAKLALVDELDGADPHSGYITGTFTAHDALKLLAQPFAGHPEHKGEEWAP